MSSIAARRANKRACPLQPNGILSRGTHGILAQMGEQLPPIEAIRIAGLSQELFGLNWIVRVRLDGEHELEFAWAEAPCRDRGPQRLRIADRLAVDGIAGRQPDPLVVPGGFGVPLALEEIQRGNANPSGKSDAQLGIRAST
jgi:hypothetical protein